ncbi:hypothetical protein I4U23_005485 [Adineta vaga]|nr:hypothetical protein I4U23_005485 [Adineta vaga]
MQKFTIVLLIFSLCGIIFCDDNECALFTNKIYQVRTRFYTYAPFYFLMLFLPDGIVYEISNIANGLNADTLGQNLQFAPHVGFYECLNSTTVHLTDFGYIFKSNEVEVLTSNGHFAFHDYFFNFESGTNANCVGTLRYKFYETGKNPFDIANLPVFTSAPGQVTCSLVSTDG